MQTAQAAQAMEIIFVLQLIGMVSAGGIIGELYRTVHSGASASIADKVFIVNFLASSFLSFLVSLSVYMFFNNKGASLILGGILAYQDEKFLKNITRELAFKILKSPEKGDIGDHGNENKRHDKNKKS